LMLNGFCTLRLLDKQLNNMLGGVLNANAEAPWAYFISWK